MSPLGATEAERRERITAALAASGGKVSAAAIALGIDRRSLHKWIRKMAGVSDGSPASTPAEARPVTLTLVLPKSLKDWLEHRALSRKHEGGGRFAVSPVVIEILEAARAAEKAR